MDALLMNRRTMIKWIQLFAVAALAYLLLPGLSHAERVKDIASVSGVRSNQVVGYGLVVGLNGTGDQTTQAPFTVQSIANMLAKFGVTLSASVLSQMQLKNVAAVTVTAELPPFVKPGQTIDLTVASIANATSLRGGALLLTPLRGADGEVYAMAQGSVMVSGFGVSGKDGSRVSVNVPSGGRIPNGGTVEREVPNTFDRAPFITLNLNSPDFTTAQRLTEALNRQLGAGTAQAVDAVSVRVDAPADADSRVAFIGTLQELEVEPADAPARVIVNSRTGTVVISSRVRVSPAAVAHGSLTVTIQERTDVSQPNSFTTRGGSTVSVPRSEINVSQADARMFVFDAGVNLDEIVRAVNNVGAAPGDLVAILEALQQAGALRAQLIVI
jgi:flagellar P-ring protein precursor FlgI